MKLIFLSNFCFFFFLSSSCSEKNAGNTKSTDRIKNQLQKLTDALADSEKNDDLQSFLKYYDKSAISMPEYQPTLQGIKEIESFYNEIFQRQNVKLLQRTADEVIILDSTVIEIGAFKKEYTDSKPDTILTQNGKYWHVWKEQSDGNFKLKGEAFGFFHPIESPEALVVKLNESNSDKSDIYLDQKMPFELKAYNALMEKGVRTRDGVLRSEFFTNDGKFMPFADSTKIGMEQLKPYLIAYSSAGNVTIDSITCYTYHYENLEDYVLEYAKFKVKWTVPQFSGRSEGKSIRIWSRQKDMSLRLFREIGTHNHLE